MGVRCDQSWQPEWWRASGCGAKHKLVDIAELTIARDFDVQIISGDGNVLNDTFFFKPTTH